MAARRTLRALHPAISWQQTGKPQQTIASAVERSGTGLHTGAPAAVRLLPAPAGEGRSFALTADSVEIDKIPASIDRVVECRLCTSLCSGSARVSTIEHLMSALEGCGVDNVRVEIGGGFEEAAWITCASKLEDSRSLLDINVGQQMAGSLLVPIMDGSSLYWVEAIEEAGICSAKDDFGEEIPRSAPVVHEPLYTWENDSFVAAFPSSSTRITYGINFPQVPAIGCQWRSHLLTDKQEYCEEIAPSRTFCVFEEIERLRRGGLIQGGSLENAIICSIRDGWINPPLRFDDEPCRHKILDLIGDLSLLSENGNQGLPVAHLVAYKAGHALHARFASMLKSRMMRHGDHANQISAKV